MLHLIKKSHMKIKVTEWGKHLASNRSIVDLYFLTNFVIYKTCFVIVVVVVLDVQFFSMLIVILSVCYNNTWLAMA